MGSEEVLCLGRVVAQLERLLLEGLESGEPVRWDAEYREALREELRVRRLEKR